MTVAQRDEIAELTAAAGRAEQDVVLLKPPRPHRGADRHRAAPAVSLQSRMPPPLAARHGVVPLSPEVSEQPRQDVPFLERLTASTRRAVSFYGTSPHLLDGRLEAQPDLRHSVWKRLGGLLGGERSEKLRGFLRRRRMQARRLTRTQRDPVGQWPAFEPAPDRGTRLFEMKPEGDLVPQSA